MIRQNYTYSANVLDVHDGDTIHLDVKLRTMLARGTTDLGFSVYVEGRWLRVHEDFRLLGIDCAELGTPSGDAAKTFLDNYLRLESGKYAELTIKTVKQADQEKFGRWLATIWLGAGLRNPAWDSSVNARMIDSGHAREWSTSAAAVADPMKEPLPSPGW